MSFPNYKSRSIIMDLGIMDKDAIKSVKFIIWGTSYSCLNSLPISMFVSLRKSFFGTKVP